MNENGLNCNNGENARVRHKREPNAMRQVRKDINRAAWAIADRRAEAKRTVEVIEESIAELAAAEAEKALKLMEERRIGASYNDLGLSAARLVGVSRLIREKSTSNPGRASLTDDQKRRELMDLMLENARGEAVEAEVAAELPPGE